MAQAAEPLPGRTAQCAAADRLLAAAGRGAGGALVLHGGPGWGKTALLDWVRGRAGAAVDLHTAGVPAESRLPGAGLHRLLRPLRSRLDGLPAAQATALRRVLGERPGRPDPLVLGTALLDLLATAAGGPVVCRVDDTDGLDPLSLAALGFAARRLAGTPVALLLTADGPPAPGGPLAGLPALPLPPLDPAAARQVLLTALAGLAVPGLGGAARPGPAGAPDAADRPATLGGQAPVAVAEPVLAAVLARAAGNPLALVELAGALAAAPGPSPPATAATGWPGGPLARPTGPQLPPGSRLRRRHRERVRRLPAPVRQLLLTAAAAGPVEPEVLRRAGTPAPALAAAEAAGLLRVTGDRAEPADPLLAESVYADADPARRRAVHARLAAALDPRRRAADVAWHRAAAGGRPAAELAGGLAAAAVAAERAGDHRGASRCYERSAELAGSPRTAGRRLLAAAHAAWSAGDGPRARELLARGGSPATGGPAPAGLLRAEIELRSGTVPGAYDALAPVAAGLDRSGGLASPGGRAAVAALLQAGEVIELAGDHARFLALAERVVGLHAADPAARLVVAQFTGLAAAYRGQHRRAAVPLRRALELAGPTGTPVALTAATVAAMTLNDGESSLAVAAQAVELARAVAAPQLPESLGLLAFAEFQAGRYAAAATHAEEGLRRARELGQDNTAAALLSVLALLAAVTGDGAAAVGRARAAAGPASGRGVVRPLALATWARVRLGLADGAGGPGPPVGPATTRGMHPTIRVLATPDLVEAMVRQGDRARAGRLLAVFDRWATGTGSGPMRALAARCRGLLADSDGAAADAYAEALALHGTGALDLERARTQLLYGRAVRHGRRPAAAREHLHDALAVFERLDAGPWAERARAELRAAGAATGGPPPPAGGLTPQQDQVARLVAAGATNREVAAQLVLSTRTVEHHLRQVFVRLGVRSRTELALRLAGADR